MTMRLNFKNWLLQEMGDILNRDTSHVNLVKDGFGFIYIFEFNNNQYIVKFNEKSVYWTNSYIEHVYEISFKGPSDYNSTGISGSSANVIYAQLLLAVKKLFETTEVNGLKFYPAEPKMGLIYRRFFNQYLKKDFMQVDSTNYLRKTKLKEILQGLDRYSKEYALKNTLANKRDVLSTKKRIEQERLNRLKVKKLINKIVHFEYGRGVTKLAYLVKLDRESAIVLYLYENNEVIQDSYGVNSILSEETNQTVIADFLTKMAANPNRIFNKIYTSDGKLQNLFKQYNIEVTTVEEMMKKSLNKFFKFEEADDLYYLYDTHHDYYDNYFNALTNNNDKIAKTIISSISQKKLKPADSNDIHKFLTQLANEELYVDYDIKKIIKNNDELQKLFKIHNIEINATPEINEDEILNNFYREGERIIYFYEVNRYYSEPTFSGVIKDKNSFSRNGFSINDFTHKKISEKMTKDVTEEEIKEFLSLATKSSQRYSREMLDVVNQYLTPLMQRYNNHQQNDTNPPENAEDADYVPPPDYW